MPLAPSTPSRPNVPETRLNAAPGQGRDSVEAFGPDWTEACSGDANHVRELMTAHQGTTTAHQREQVIMPDHGQP
jgi:hypothetical protein